MLKKDLGLFLLILVVGCVVAILNPRFLSPINLGNTANLIGLFGLFSIGEAFVIITGGIDLSIGSMFALLGVIYIDLLVTWQLPWWLAAIVTVLGGVVLGSIHGFLVTRLKLQPFIVTLCGLLIYRGVARYYTNDGTAGFEFGQTFPTLEWLTAGRTLGVPHSFIVFLIVALVMGIVLHRSVFGRYLFAVGKNEEAARYSGIRTTTVIAAAYIISGALAGLSSIYLAMYTRSISPASHGNFYELYGIAAAGRPIIAVGASDGEVGRLVRRHNCGVLVEPGQGELLADRLRCLRANPGRLAEMGRRARAMLEVHFTRRQAFERWRSLVDEISPVIA